MGDATVSVEPSVTPNAGAKPPLDAASRALRWAIWLLLGVYCTPLVLITYSYFATDWFSNSSAILVAFVGFATAGDDSLSLLHRVLLPMVGAFAPLAFRDESSSWSSNWLIALLIVAIALSLFLSGVFNSSAVQANLKPLSLFALPGGSDAPAVKEAAFSSGMVAVKSFFSRTQEAMGMYLMLLFGLKLEKATK